MTPDERNLLNDMATKFAQTPSPPKDPEAEEFIRTHIGNRPDALYLMTQTVLIQNLALQHAQEQVRDLQQRSGQPAQVGSGSFLGGGASGQQTRGSYAPSGGGGQQQYSAPPPQYAAPGGAMPNPGGQPSFLRGAAQTAAGVAAGALAFEGIQSLFSHPGYGGGGGFFGGGGGGFMGGGAPVEEVVNNYYDNPSGGSGGDYSDYRAEERDNDQDSGDNSGQFDDSGQYDDSSNFDDGGDTGGGFDDSGSNFA